MARVTGLILLIGLVMISLAGAADKPEKKLDPTESVEAYEAYKKVIGQTAGMVSDPAAQKLAQKHGLQILNITWEDTGRYKGSSVGPNISDMTIQVQQMDPRNEKFALTCMPVIRFPNFSDKTADIKTDKFFLLVGNEKGKPLMRVSLDEYLSNIRKYMSNPDSWKGKSNTLLANRDTHVLVSAQACFLPIPKKGGAEFNPVIFNYQSYQGDPAVLTILATREGTSATIIDNKRDGFQAGYTWGQRLFFNQKGERASLTGKRLTDFNEENKNKPEGEGDKTEATTEANGQEGLNMVLLIQVPLKQKKPLYIDNPSDFTVDKCDRDEGKSAGSDVEDAVIGHGKVEGPFTEIDNLEIERDPKFPVRVTVQFYKATSNGVVSEADMESIAKQIDKVYSDADFVGSLVTEGITRRPTEYDGNKVQPPDWWEKFWARHEANTGTDRDRTIQTLIAMNRIDPDHMPRKESEMVSAMKDTGLDQVQTVAKKVTVEQEKAEEESKRFGGMLFVIIAGVLIVVLLFFLLYKKKPA